MLVGRLLRRRDRDELDLVELMLAQHAARVATSTAGFGTEAGGECGEAQRQFFYADDGLADEVGQGNLSGGYEAETSLAVFDEEEVLFEFRQLVRAKERIVLH